MKRGKMTNIELKELIYDVLDARLANIENKIDSGNNIITYQIKDLKESNCEEHGSIITHQKITNSRVTHLEEVNVERDKKLQLWEWINDNKKSFLFITIVGWFVLNVLSDVITWADIFKLIK